MALESAKRVKKIPCRNHAEWSVKKSQWKNEAIDCRRFYVNRKCLPCLAPNSFIENYISAVQKELINRKNNLHKLPLLSQVSGAEYLGYTQHTLLKDTDQMSMAVSLEVREPFFDPDLAAFVLAVPDRFKKGNLPKKLLVESLQSLLPDEIVTRKKKGFLFPWNFWLRNELRSFCEIHIKSISQRSFINEKNLLSYWKRFLSGDENVRWSEIWLFVVLENWIKNNDVE